MGHILFIILLVVYIFNILLKLLFCPSGYEKKIPSKSDIEIIESEFSLQLTNNQELQKIAYFHFRESNLNILIDNIEDKNRFVTENLRMNIDDFEEVSERESICGYRSYKYYNIENPNEVEIYQESEDNSYKAYIYKINNINDYEGLDEVFKYIPNKYIWNWRFWIFFWE